MNIPSLRSLAAPTLLAALALLPAPTRAADPAIELLNVSYDPTRELYRDLNAAFTARYARDAGRTISIQQSHGGSSTQARSVIDGLEADVVTLAMWTDVDAIAKKGLIAKDWEGRLPNRSLPYYSTIVFVVRKGNPKGIKDWSDLVKKAAQIITPNPKTSGNGKLSFLAAWGSVLLRKGTEKEAQEFVSALYRQVPVLDSGARGATTTFSQKKIGDVHLTWENEAHLEVQESGGELEIVYPPISIRAEPHVALVDSVTARKGTREAAEAYLKFLYTSEAQDIIARRFYRPSDPKVAKRYAKVLPKLRLFAITDISKGWDDAQQRFFVEGALFDRIYQPAK